MNLSGAVIGAQHLGLNTSFGSSISLVGLDFNNRRRNRLNGTLKSGSEDQRLSIAAKYSFGNCSKYVQFRHYSCVSSIGETKSSSTISEDKFEEFSEQDIKLINNEDTLFIASADKKDGDLDVNHRGSSQALLG